MLGTPARPSLGQPPRLPPTGHLTARQPAWGGLQRTGGGERRRRSVGNQRGEGRTFQRPLVGSVLFGRPERGGR